MSFSISRKKKEVQTEKESIDNMNLVDKVTKILDNIKVDTNSAEESLKRFATACKNAIQCVLDVLEQLYKHLSNTEKKFTLKSQLKDPVTLTELEDYFQGVFAEMTGYMRNLETREMDTKLKKLGQFLELADELIEWGILDAKLRLMLHDAQGALGECDQIRKAFCVIREKNAELKATLTRILEIKPKGTGGARFVRWTTEGQARKPEGRRHPMKVMTGNPRLKEYNLPQPVIEQWVEDLKTHMIWFRKDLISKNVVQNPPTYTRNIPAVNTLTNRDYKKHLLTMAVDVLCSWWDWYDKNVKTDWSNGTVKSDVFRSRYFRPEEYSVGTGVLDISQNLLGVITEGYKEELEHLIPRAKQLCDRCMRYKLTPKCCSN